LTINHVNIKVNQLDKSWDVYIHDAESQLRAIKEREKGLIEVIARFKMFRDRGEPWPLSESASAPRDSVPRQVENQTPESCHSV